MRRPKATCGRGWWRNITGQADNFWDGGYPRAVSAKNAGYQWRQAFWFWPATRTFTGRIFCGE